MIFNQFLITYLRVLNNLINHFQYAEEINLKYLTSF